MISSSLVCLFVTLIVCTPGSNKGALVVILPSVAINPVGISVSSFAFVAKSIIVPPATLKETGPFPIILLTFKICLIALYYLYFMVNKTKTHYMPKFTQL